MFYSIFMTLNDALELQVFADRPAMFKVNMCYPFNGIRLCDKCDVVKALAHLPASDWKSNKHTEKEYESAVARSRIEDCQTETGVKGKCLLQTNYYHPIKNNWSDNFHVSICVSNATLKNILKYACNCCI